MTNPKATADPGAQLLAAGQNFVDKMKKSRARKREDSYIEVTMLGPTGAGKTTMLASMYETFTRVVGNTDLDIIPHDTQTSITLQDILDELNKMPGEFKVVKGLSGTGEVREYLFDVGRRGRKPLFKIRFTDYPGLYFVNNSKMDSLQREQIDAAIKRADVVVIAIDTPAMMEANGKYNKPFNTPGTIVDVVFRMLRENTDRLIILAPLKCEKYMSSPEGRAALMNEIYKVYKEKLFDRLTGDLAQRVGCVVTPVQTIGSVTFDRIEMVGDQPSFVFRSTSYGAAYKPVDNDQPLRYALQFILGKYRDTANPLKSYAQRLMGRDATLLAAMETFGSDCKVGNGFTVVQGHRFLRSRRGT